MTMTNGHRAQRHSAALSNATGRQSAMNYATIIKGFTDKGIAAADIKPRENIFTFGAWRALGRCVKKGEHGIAVCTFAPASKIDKETGKIKEFHRPRQTFVFHVSQTDPLTR